MNGDALQHFLTLIDTRHFGRAAERCHLSHSAFSRSIARLEAQLGSRLLERDKRQVRLTPAGERLVPVARQLLAQWEAICQSLQPPGVLEGSLRLYCSVTASYSFLYDILARFRQLHPKVAITVSTGDPAAAIERVRMGLDDFAIAAHYPGFPSQLSFKPIATTPLILIAPLGEAPAPPASPDTSQQLMTVPLILPEQGPARRRFDRYCLERGLTPRLYAEAAGNEAIVSMVSLGFGVGLVPQLVLDNSPLRNRVQVWNYPLPLDDLIVGLCVLEKRLQQPVIHAFWSGLSP